MNAYGLSLILENAMQLTQKSLIKVIDIAREAGNLIMQHYGDTHLSIVHKNDLSPLTIADQLANQLIRNPLLAMNDLPYLSEESDTIDFEARKHWTQFWMVDPLDGTK